MESYNDTRLVAIVGTRHIREMRLTWTIWRANWRQTVVYTCRHRGHATYSVCVGRVALNQTSCGDLSNKIKKITKRSQKLWFYLRKCLRKLQECKQFKHTQESESMVARLLCCFVRVHLQNHVFFGSNDQLLANSALPDFFFADIVKTWMLWESGCNRIMSDKQQISPSHQYTTCIYS